MELNEKDIEKASKKIDLSGFKMQDNLNPKIWSLPNEKYMGDPDGQVYKMKPEVKKTLLKIADDYFESLDLPGIDIEDVTMTGSLANYNWSKYSDVDLHIVVDYDDLPMERELVQDFFKSKSSNWNKEHDVKIYGYDVELYVQDINEPHHSTGVYSILNNEWNIEPEKKEISFNDKSVKEKAERLMDRIEEIYDEMDEVDNEETVERVNKLTEKIKKMRQSGLESGGEFSVENIVFKVLRRNGMLDRLYDIKTVAYDRSVTLESEGLSKLTESMLDDELGWIRDSEFSFKIGDVFVTKYNFHNINQERSEHTFEIYDTSPDGNLVRFSNHSTRGIFKDGVMGSAYLPIDKINRDTISKNWDESGYNPANSTTTEQVTKNIMSGFWVKLNTNGYLIDNPSEYDKIIKLGSKLTESFEGDFGWASEIEPIMQPELLKSGQKFIQYLPKGETRVLQFISKGDETVSYERPLTLFYFKVVYGWLTGHELTFNTLDLVKRFKEGNLEPILDDGFKFLGESEDVESKHKSKINKYVDNLTKNFTKFIDALKNERVEVVDAYKKLINSVKEGKKLSYQEKKEIGDKLKDVLRLSGFIFATLLPGGFIYLVLAKTTKLKKHLIPKSFWDNRNSGLNENEDPLEWIKNTNPTKITSVNQIHNLIRKTLTNETIKHGEWIYYLDRMSGSITWNKIGVDYITFWATPFWNDEDSIPIDYQDEDGYGHVIMLPTPTFEYEEEFLEWFSEQYPKTVIPIMEEFLKDTGPLPE